MRVELNDTLDEGRGHDGRPVDGLPRPHAWSSPRTSILEPDVVLRGATTVGARTRIAHGLPAPRHASIGEDCVIWASILERSTVEDEVTIGPFSPPPARAPTSAAARRSATSPRSRTAASATHVRQHHMSYLGDADVGAGHERRGGHDHRQLRRRGASTARRSARACSSASTRCSGRRSRWATASRTGAGSVVTRDVPAGQARGRRAGPDPRDPARRRRDTADPRRRRPVQTRSRGRRRLMGDTLIELADSSSCWSSSTASSSPPRSRSCRSAAAASSSWSTRGGRGARRVRRLLERPGPVPRGRPARPHVHRLPRLGVRRRQPRRRPRRPARSGSAMDAGTPGVVAPARRDDPAVPVHDRVRRARAEDARPRPPRARSPSRCRGRSTSSGRIFRPLVALLTAIDARDHAAVRRRRHAPRRRSRPRSCG